MISKNDAATFPFLKDASKYVKGVSLEIFNDDSLFKIIDDYLYNIHAGKIPQNLEDDVDLSIKRFLGCCIVINQIKRPTITKRFIGVQVDRYIEKLVYYYNKNQDFNIYFDLIYNEILKNPPKIQKTQVDVLRVNRLYRYLSDNKKPEVERANVVRLVSFLQLISGLKGDEFTLQYQIGVKKGYVFFDDDVLLCIIKERLKLFLEDKISKLFELRPSDYDIEKKRIKASKYLDPIVIPQRLRELINKYEYLDTYVKVYGRKDIDYEKEYDKEKLAVRIVNDKKLKKTVLPPCVLHVLGRFERNMEVSHFGRLLLAKFMLKDKMPIEEIVDYFRNDVKFNEEYTLMQLKQISNRDYMTPNCDKIKTAGYCFRDEKICGFITNPIQLIGAAK